MNHENPTSPVDVRRIAVVDVLANSLNLTIEESTKGGSLAFLRKHPLHLGLQEGDQSTAEVFDAQLMLTADIVVVGGMEDPFAPFEGKFNRTLKLLNQLAAEFSGEVIVRTRSPLVVLALPALRKLGTRLSIVVALEAMTDQLQIKYFPAASRPSERIKLARTLKRFGFPTVLQLAPITGRLNRATMQTLAGILDDISSSIIIFPAETIGVGHWGKDGAINIETALQGDPGREIPALEKILRESVPRKINFSRQHRRERLVGTVAA